jgi:hypothetical protein
MSGGALGGFALGGTSDGAIEETVNDGLVTTDSVPVTTIARVNEALALAISTELSEVNALVEVLALDTGATLATALRLATLTETLGLTATATPVFVAALNSGLVLTDVANTERIALVSLVDSLVLTGAATGTMTAIALVTEALALADVATRVDLATITDDLALTELLQTTLTAYETLVSAAVFGDTRDVVVTLQVDETVALAETVTPIAAFIETIRDGLDFAISFVFDGEAYLALSMNAATKALSTYTNYPFNSFASFNGQTYAASSEGLYRLGGTTDAGTEITWRLRTGMSNFGTGRNKGLDAAYLGWTASGKIALKCIIVAPTGEKVAYWYELTPRPAANMRPERIPTGRGMRTVYMGFELTNVNASDLELDILELHPVIFEGRL